MKCPHCKKEIKDIPGGKDMFYLFMFNCFYPMFAMAIILSLMDKYTSIPMSISDGLNANYYLFPLLIIALFYMVYIPLYKFNKVKGRLLIYTYWIDKER